VEISGSSLSIILVTEERETEEKENCDFGVE